MSNTEEIIDKQRHYELISPIGAGSYATVWKAFDFQANMYCAIKLYEKGRVDLRQIMLAHEEIGKLHHPNIVPIKECFFWGNKLVVVMPYYSKGSIEDLCGSMSEDDLWRLSQDVAGGLEYLHSRGFLHLDIKPANILVDDNDGRFIIADFGRSMEKTQVYPGVPVIMHKSYMAPEQHLGDDVSSACDIWSMGATLYEMAVGFLPYNGQDGLWQFVQGDKTPMAIIGEKYSARLNELVSACLIPNPVARPTAEELVRFTEGENKHLGTSNKYKHTKTHQKLRGSYSKKAMRRLADYKIKVKSPESPLYGVADGKGNQLVDYQYDFISSFVETAWPGPGVLPPAERCFLGAYFVKGGIVGYLYIKEDGSIEEYGRCTKEQFRILSQLT